MSYALRMAETVAFLLRIPRDLLAEIRSLAEREQRTVSGQIVHLLRRGLEESKR